MLEASVRTWGFDPVAAADGGEAWQVMNRPDAPRVAILDWMMPVMDGPEVVRRVRERSPCGETLILMLTANGERGAVAKGLAAGADDYLLKPFDRAELEMRLRAGLRGRAAGMSAADGQEQAWLGGRYRLRAVLGEGGMGTVYEAEHVDLGALFALKLMKPDVARDAGARARFAREAHAASLIRSEHVCRVHDYGVTPAGQPYMVMDRLWGETLAQAIGRRGPLPADEVIRAIRQAGAGLAAAHQRGVLHRDVTPANVFLDEPDEGTAVCGRGPSFTAKLVDFGIASLLDTSTTRMTAEDQTCGTLEYMSPERLKGTTEGAPIDLWGLAVTACEALTARSPFEGRTIGEIVYRVCVAPRPIESLAPLGGGVQAWFERACAIDPARRFGTIEDLVDALDRAVHASATNGH